jgi:hypothetical protein
VKWRFVRLGIDAEIGEEVDGVVAEKCGLSMAI